MSAPYIGEIRMFAGNFAPAGWALCLGQTVAIAQNDALFNLIGTTYGGDGQQTFNLPNLSSRIPRHQTSGYVMGQVGGQESVTVTLAQLADHTHPLLATNDPSSSSVPANSVLAATGTTPAYEPGVVPNRPLNPSSLTPTGGSQPHDNLQPFLTFNFIIALTGIYPTT